MTSPETQSVYRTVLFIVGCPRSGTTWTQLLLAQHPAVATSQETHVFDNYLGVLERCWRGEAETPTRRATGLRSLLSDDEFYGLCRAFATDVLRKIAEKESETEVVVEKSPQHVLRAELIHRLLPDARFLHVIRDPRSVVCSLREAGRTWGDDWAPSSTPGCAESWVSHVTAGRRIGELTEHYREIRYEDLQANAANELGGILAWLGLSYDDEFCTTAAEACRIEKLKSGSDDVSVPWELDDEPEGMYRKGTRESWREELTSGELRTVEYIARDLMETLEYRPASRRYRSRPVRLALRAGVKRIVSRVRPVWEPVLRRLETAAST